MKKSILLRRKTQLIHQSLINPLDSFSRFSLPSYPVVTRGCLSVHKAICKFFLIPVTLGTAAFLAFFTVRNCNAAPHKRNKTELSALRTPKKINSRPDGRNKKNQFFQLKVFRMLRLDLFLPSDPAAFSSSFSRSGATCQAAGYLHVSYEDMQVLFRASFS